MTSFPPISAGGGTATTSPTPVADTVNALIARQINGGGPAIVRAGDYELEAQIVITGPGRVIFEPGVVFRPAIAWDPAVPVLKLTGVDLKLEGSLTIDERGYYRVLANAVPQSVIVTNLERFDCAGLRLRFLDTGIATTIDTLEDNREEIEAAIGDTLENAFDEDDELVGPDLLCVALDALDDLDALYPDGIDAAIGPCKDGSFGPTLHVRDATSKRGAGVMCATNADDERALDAFAHTCRDISFAAISTSAYDSAPALTEYGTGTVGIRVASIVVDGDWLRTSTGVVDVKWFGAKGDAAADDTAAVQAAIDYLGSRGGTVVFPNGVYRVAGLTVGGEGQVNSITFRGEVPAGYLALERLVVDQVVLDVGTMLKFIGADDSDALLDIRNCDMGHLEGLAFVGSNLAKHCVRWTHNLGDTRPPYNWTVSKCSFVDAKLYDVKTDGSGEDAYGDISGLTFIGCHFPGAHNPAATIAHYCNSTQYTFGVTFIGCNWTSGLYPLYAIDMHSGTANVIGGAMQGATACIRLLAAAGDFPAVNVWGVECQSSGKFLVTDSTPEGENTPNRSSTIVGLLADDINEPIATEMIYWDVEGEASLTLIGCNIFGDVNAANANSKVFVQGSYLRNAARFTGPGKVDGTWYQGGTPGTLQHRFADLPEYANNAAAVLADLAVGDLYKTAGAVMVVI